MPERTTFGLPCIGKYCSPTCVDIYHLVNSVYAAACRRKRLLWKRALAADSNRGSHTVTEVT